jgi:uncharacterized membrane protein
MQQPFLLILVSVCFAVTGELLLKAGMNDVGELSSSNLGAGLVRCLTNARVMGGFASLGFGSIIWLVVLSKVNLSWAYPMLSIGYILVLIFSDLFLNEHVTAVRWLGTLVVCTGVFLIFRS